MITIQWSGLEVTFETTGVAIALSTIVSFTYLSSHRGAGFLQEIPQLLPLVRTAGVIKLPLALPIPHGLCLPPQLLIHLFFLLVVAGLAAGLQVNLIDPPVV